MEILLFEDLGDTESVVTNAVVLVLADCQISMATCLSGAGGGGGGIYPHIKLSCNVLGIDNVMSRESHRGRTDTQTDRRPHYNSFASASRRN